MTANCQLIAFALTVRRTMQISMRHRAAFRSMSSKRLDRLTGVSHPRKTALPDVAAGRVDAECELPIQAALPTHLIRPPACVRARDDLADEPGGRLYRMALAWLEHSDSSSILQLYHRPSDSRAALASLAGGDELPKRNLKLQEPPGEGVLKATGQATTENVRKKRPSSCLRTTRPEYGETGIRTPVTDLTP